MNLVEQPLDLFERALRTNELGVLRRASLTTLQVNVGRVCNQACTHCHVGAGPKRTESMDEPTVERLLWLLERNRQVGILDITGGAPELNPCFRSLVTGARQLGCHVLDRCNLTILSEPGQEGLAAFLAEQQVEIIASMPCYSQSNVDRQRGHGVFERSIFGLMQLNELGYGVPGSGLVVNLVYNPGGAFLPPSQAGLEADYRRVLGREHGLVFNRLYTITNMPIARFAHDLDRSGRHEAYMELLARSFNPAAVDPLMCRTLLSVGWDGRLFDCDFNQMLELELGEGPGTIWDLVDLGDLTGRRVATGSHCLGCTAGAGSSCGGALA